jgi:protoporphyrinogen oxidase
MTGALVLGGGLSGMSAAWALARAGVKDVTLVERGTALGGLAGSFEEDGYFYPLGYHHILHRDRTLLFFLERIGALPRVSWRRVHMLFRTAQGAYDLANPVDFLRFPMAFADKLRFTLLMARAFGKDDWTDGLDEGGDAHIDRWAGPGVRASMFESLTRLKFQLPCSEVSAAWLGARLHYREGSSALGYIPGTTWTKVLCDGVAQLLAEAGVQVRTGVSVTRVVTSGDRVAEVALDDGTTYAPARVVSTIPTESWVALVPGDDTRHLREIRYSALLSALCVVRQPVARDFYWMNFATADRTAGGLFLLNSLNPTIGRPGENVLNFVTHLQGRDRELFRLPDDELWERYLHDGEFALGFRPQPSWRRINRVAMYSPVLRKGYRNPPVRSTRFGNVFFAGNYRTFPSIVSTGTALASGLWAAQAIAEADGLRSPVLEDARRQGLPRDNPATS